MEKHDLNDIMEVPDDYYIISEPKLKITKAIEEQLNKKNMSIRGLGEKINMKHPQIIRVTSCRNYNIDTLLKILDGLDLEITVQPK
ncbi:hypothetical protein G3M81_23200 [Bacillus paralicheniformis]|jgi:HTH-type transcriptional regulator/antitoxin HipB|uniref:hypothetical protein n=1 Tax=Bacillus TaxID=1386 RepID=UPI0013EE981F|nr:MULTISPECIES: hypothetical protein [Bacillus]QII26903.1 hypothetical protein G3M80_20615 [Bacillus altitudinis]QII51468.1 hypothetical protein G3M81_23200 [Bacillus paralicheniformis]